MDGDADLDGIVNPDDADLAQIQRILAEDSDDEEEDNAGEKSKNFLEEIEFEHPEIATYQELFWQFFFMPVVIYAGLGRLVVLTERKTTVS